MPLDVLDLQTCEGTLFVGLADRLAAFLGAAAGPQGCASPLHEIDALRADGWRLRNPAIAWNLQRSGRLKRPDCDLGEQITGLVETGRLVARFVPLFRDDPRSPNETGPLRLYQLGGGPPPAPEQAPRPSASTPPPQRAQVRSAVEAEKDFPDEDAQVEALREAAARDGKPFCEICTRMALRAAKALA
jgi:hypothetical protein